MSKPVSNRNAVLAVVLGLVAIATFTSAKAQNLNNAELHLPSNANFPPSTLITPVLSWGWVADNDLVEVDDVPQAGEFAFSRLRIDRLTDEASALLLGEQNSRGGSDLFPTFENLKIVGDGFEIQLSEAQVRNYTVSGKFNKKVDKAFQLESIELSFTQVQYSVGSSEFCWDLTLNISCDL